MQSHPHCATASSTFPSTQSQSAVTSFIPCSQPVTRFTQCSLGHSHNSVKIIHFFHTMQSQILNRHLFHTMQSQSPVSHTAVTDSYMFHTLQSQLLSWHLFYTQQSQSLVSHTAVTVTCFTHCSHSYLICTCCTQCGHRQLHNAVFAIYHHTYITKQVQITGVMEQWSVEGQDTGSRVSKMETTAGVRQQSGFICSAADNF